MLALVVVIFAVLTVSSAGSVREVLNDIYAKLDAEMVINESVGSADADRASLIITSFLAVGALSNAIVSVFFFAYGCIKHDKAKEIASRMRANEMEVAKIEIGCRPGMTVIMEHMDDPNPIEYGTKGVIENIDDLGTIHVKWENGRRLGVIPGVDSFKIVDEKINLKEKEER